MRLSRKCGVYRGKVVINRRGDVPKTNAYRKTNAGDLMEGGKPPRDCKQSLRPYNKH